MGILEKISKKPADQDADVKDEQKKANKTDDKKETKKADAKPAAKSKKEPAKAKEADAGVKRGKAAPEKAFAYGILLAPVLTEKGDRGQMSGKYTFYVSPDANKVEVSRAVRTIYGVKPESVRIMNVKGKKVRFGRLQGQRKARKKAVVTLKKGDVISVAD